MALMSGKRADRPTRRFGWACRGTFDLDSPPFDWGADYVKPNIPFNDLVIYEAAVRGFTAHQSSKLGPLAGSYLGVAAKIDHLKELGINAIELLPVRGTPRVFVTQAADVLFASLCRARRESKDCVPK